MKEIDIAENAYHNGYEKGKIDGWIECCDYLKEKFKERFKKGGEKDGKEMAEGGEHSSNKDDGADRYCEHRNLCALN